MTMSSDATPNATFAVRCFKVSRAIHWVTVAPFAGCVLPQRKENAPCKLILMR
jgi:hypothetical protein